MNILHQRLALHTWTLDSTPLIDVLRIAREVGYQGIELRHADFMRCRRAGLSDEAIVELVRESNIRVAVVGTENGVLFASGEELKRLLGSLRYVSEMARALDCGLVMMPPGSIAAGAPGLVTQNLKACAEITAGHGLRLALEFNSRHPVVRTLKDGLEVVDAVNMENCGLLLDTYHLHCSGGNAASLRQVPVEQIFTVQFSDAPPGPPSDADVAIDRLPPGMGAVPFVEIFKTLIAMNYQGTMSYEAPNPAQWSRSAVDVAREGLERVRALLRLAEQAR